MAAYETQGYKMDNTGRRVVVEPSLLTQKQLRDAGVTVEAVDMDGRG